MKRTFNLTTYSDDLDRYADRADLLSALRDFDGVELMHCGPDSRGVVHRQPVLISFNAKYAPRPVSPEVEFRVFGRVLH